MNRIRIITAFLCIALCFSLSACSEKAAEPALPGPASMPELESVVEPLENIEPVSDSEESASETSESVPESRPEPSSVPEPVPAELESSHAPADVEPSASEPPVYRKAESASPELLNSVLPEQKLSRGLVEQELLRLINELRAEVGVEALGSQEEMRFAAQIRSSEALHNFSHTRPDGSTYNTAFDEAGFSYAGKWHGENLTSLSFTYGMLDEKAAALEMFSGLKASPGHYRNMTGENFLQAGIGVSISYESEMVNIASAQLFASL